MAPVLFRFQAESLLTIPFLLAVGFILWVLWNLHNAAKRR